MPTLTIPNSFSPNTTAQSSQVNANFSAISTLINTTLLANDNIQAGGIATANLAASSVTGAKLNSNVVDNSTLQYSSSQLSIKAAGVGTTQLADSSVTQAKRAALGQQISSSSGSFSSASASYVDVTNLSVSITTTGRPVWVGLTSDGTVTGANSSSFVVTGSSLQSLGSAVLLRGATTIFSSVFGSTVGSGTTTFTTYTPVSQVWIIEAPAAGTYTYKVQASVVAGSSIAVKNAVLVAYEL